MGNPRSLKLQCLSQGHQTRSQCRWNSSPGLSDSQAVPFLRCSAVVQSGARGDGLCFKGAPDSRGVPEQPGPLAPGWGGVLASPSPQGSGMGLMSLLVDVGPRRPGLPAAFPAQARPARCLQHARPSRQGVTAVIQRLLQWQEQRG